MKHKVVGIVFGIIGIALSADAGSVTNFFENFEVGANRIGSWEVVAAEESGAGGTGLMCFDQGKYKFIASPDTPVSLSTPVEIKIEFRAKRDGKGKFNAIKFLNEEKQSMLSLRFTSTPTNGVLQVWNGETKAWKTISDGLRGNDFSGKSGVMENLKVVMTGGGCGIYLNGSQLTPLDEKYENSGNALGSMLFAGTTEHSGAWYNSMGIVSGL